MGIPFTYEDAYAAWFRHDEGWQARALASMRNEVHLKQPMVPYGLGDIAHRLRPSDADVDYDHHNRAQVLVECKYKRQALPTGQRLYVEHRMWDHYIQKPCLALIAVTDIEAPTPVLVAICQVTHAWYRGTWWQYGGAEPVLVHELFNPFWQRVDNELEGAWKSVEHDAGMLLDGWKRVGWYEI